MLAVQAGNAGLSCKKCCSFIARNVDLSRPDMWAVGLRHAELWKKDVFLCQRKTKYSILSLNWKSVIARLQVMYRHFFLSFRLLINICNIVLLSSIYDRVLPIIQR